MPRKDSTAEFYKILLGKINTMSLPKTHTAKPRGINYPDLSGVRVAKELRAPSGKDIYGNTLSEDNQALQTELEGVNYDISQLGGEPEKHGSSIFTRALDILLRPNYMVANMVRQGEEAVVEGKSVGDVFKNMATGGYGGLSGKHKTSFSDVIQQTSDQLHAAHSGKTPEQVEKGEGTVNPWLKGGVGLTLDIGLDPSTYLGFGAVSHIAQAVKASEKAGRTVDTIVKGAKITDLEKELVSGRKAIGKTKAEKGQHLVTDVAPLIGRMARDTAKINKAGVLEEALKGGAKKREAEHLMSQVIDEEAQKLNKELTDNYLRVANTPVERRLAIRYTRLPGLGRAEKGRFDKLGIPGSEKLAKALLLPTRIDPVKRATDSFLKHMKNSWGIDPVLHSKGLRDFGYGTTKLVVDGKNLIHTYSRFGKAERQIIQENALHGAQSGHLLDEGIDAAEAANLRIKHIQSRIDGVLDPDMRIKKIDEVNKWFFGPNKISRPAKASDEWLLDSLKNSDLWKTKDVGATLWQLESALARAETIQALKKSLTEFGMIAEHDLKRTGAHMSNRYGWKSAQGLGKDFEHVLFDPEVAEGITKLMKQLTDNRQMQLFGRTIASINRPIKTALTKYSPSFHLRNAYGDAFINHLDHVSPRLDYPIAMATLRRRKGFEKFDEAAEQYPLIAAAGDPLENALRFGMSTSKRQDTRFAKGLQNRMKLKAADGKVYDYISLAEIEAGYARMGLRQTYSQGEFAKEFRQGTNPLTKTADAVTHLSERREDVFRMAHFVSLVRQNTSKTKNLEDAMIFASNRVRDTHFDYTDFTRFEKTVMSNAFPFYKWTRKMLPLMIDILFTQPGKVALIPKWERAISNMAGIPRDDNELFPGGVDAIVPQWMRNAGFTPFTKQSEGGNWYVQLPSPVTDTINQTLSPSGESPTGFMSLLSALSPIFKVPLELNQGQTFFGDIPITNKLEYAQRQLPIGNVQLQTRKGNYGTLASWLTGVSMQQNTPNRQTGELLRQRDVAYGKLKKAKENYAP